MKQSRIEFLRIRVDIAAKREFVKELPMRRVRRMAKAIVREMMNTPPGCDEECD